MNKWWWGRSILTEIVPYKSNTKEHRHSLVVTFCFTYSILHYSCLSVTKPSCVMTWAGGALGIDVWLCPPSPTPAASRPLCLSPPCPTLFSSVLSLTVPFSLVSWFGQPGSHQIVITSIIILWTKGLSQFPRDSDGTYRSSNHPSAYYTHLCPTGMPWGYEPKLLVELSRKLKGIWLHQ